MHVVAEAVALILGELDAHHRFVSVHRRSPRLAGRGDGQRVSRERARCRNRAERSMVHADRVWRAGALVHAIGQ